jgi:glycosyltransferase involved in cell wall biosynthesis
MIYCICPFSRNDFQTNVLNNFSSQSFIDKKLIIVQNAGAKWNNTSDEIILESETGISEALNTGLEYIRKFGKYDDWFCKFDDDDIYLPEYLQQVNFAANIGAQAIGKSSVWIRNSENKLWFYQDNQKQWCNDGEVVFGGTLGGNIRYAVNFKHVDKAGEDLIWWREMFNTKKYLTSASQYIYCRYQNHNHAFVYSDESLKQLYSGKLYEVIEGNPSENYPIKMELIRKKLTAADFDQIVKELKGN